MAAVRFAGSGKNMHEGRFARAIMADKSDAFACIDIEIHTVERTDGTELFFDAVQLYDVRPRLRHSPAVVRTPMMMNVDVDKRNYFMLAAIAFLASSWVY